MSKGEDGVEIRELIGVPELKRAEVLQTEVWGEGDMPDNSDLMLAIQHEGGLVAGAFKDEQMLGLIFAFPSHEQGVQHSHRLAVHPDSQGMGLGERIKWYQRTWCLERGITLVRWTYDPIRRVNAGLNIAKLGATAQTYFEDYYGKMEGINAGAQSDRLLAEWHLQAPSVSFKAGELANAPDEIKAEILVKIPNNLSELHAREPEKALAERFRVRRELTEAFSQGYQIADFDLKNHSYLLALIDSGAS